MERIQFKSFINAPREKVWNIMLDDATYREWTKVFNPDGPASFFEGDWSLGSAMKFIGSGENGSLSGMYSVVKENKPYDFLSIRHIGEIKEGKEVPWETPEGVEALENYTFTEKDGGTELVVDLDTLTEYKEMFQDMCPKALEKLKEICEK